MELFSNLLDVIFYDLISPLFVFAGKGLEVLLLEPMRLTGFPYGLQLVIIAMLTAVLSIFLRKVFKVEEKEKTFREQFLAKKQKQEDLHLISDWKSREKFAKAMDDDIDEDFNTYLAGRFVRYGLVYLLPLFLTLFWLENSADHSAVVTLQGEPFGLTAVPALVIYLVTFCLTLFLFFRVRKKVRGKIRHAVAVR